MAGKYEEIVRCSFCNKPQSQVRKMIAGPNGVFICDQCVDVCTEIIEDELGYEEENAYDDINLLKPEENRFQLSHFALFLLLFAAGLPAGSFGEVSASYVERGAASWICAFVLQG